MAGGRRCRKTRASFSGWSRRAWKVCPSLVLSPSLRPGLVRPTGARARQGGAGWTGRHGEPGRRRSRDRWWACRWRSRWLSQNAELEQTGDPAAGVSQATGSPGRAGLVRHPSLPGGRGRTERVGTELSFQCNIGPMGSDSNCSVFHIHYNCATDTKQKFNIKKACNTDTGTVF
jgi:hypothetical protein